MTTDRPMGIEVTQAAEPSFDWVDVGVTPTGCFVLDVSDGFTPFLNGPYWEDNFQSDPPEHLASGAYRWTGFKVGFWGEDEGMNVVGGEFARLSVIQSSIASLTNAPDAVREAWIQDAVDTACDGENGKTNGGDWDARWARSRVRAMLTTPPAKDDAGRLQGWELVATCPMWTVAIVTDGENVALAQKAETDFDGYYWAIEPEDALDWEPTHWIEAPAASPPQSDEGEERHG